MKRILAQVLLLAACVLLSACMELTSVITVAKDGSATIEETVLVSAQLKAMMSAGGADQPGSPSLKDIIPDKAKAEARAKKLGDGVTVKSYEPLKMPDGREGVKVIYAVEDITDVEYEPFDSGKPEGNKEAQPITFDMDDNELTVSMPEEKAGEKPAEAPKMPKEQMEQQMAMMKPMFAGMHIAFKIKAAGGIVTTDASHVKGDTVTLMEMDFDKLVGNPTAFGKFMETADDKNMTPAKAAKTFDGVDGMQFEGKKEFSISLK